MGQISEDIARRAEEFAKIERERKKSEEKRKKEAEKREKTVVAERRNVRKDSNLRLFKKAVVPIFFFCFTEHDRKKRT